MTAADPDIRAWPVGLVPFLARTAEEWQEIVPETERDTIVIFGLMEAIARAWKKIHEDNLDRYGLNHAEWTTLGILRTSPPDYRRSPTQLRLLVGQTSAGMTRILAKLENAQFVRRVPHALDGRGSDVVLTARGRRVADASFRALHAVQSELLASLDRRDRTALTSDLARLLEVLVPTTATARR